MCNRNRFGLLAAFRLTVLLALCCATLGGCAGDDGFALSLQPFFSESDLETDPHLAGVWIDLEDDVTFTFKEADDQLYTLTVDEKDGDRKSQVEFESHLVRLGTHRYLDLFPKSGSEGSAFFLIHLVPAHSLARVEISQDKLQLAFLDGAWLKKQIDDKTVDVPFRKTAWAMLLTGTTDEVQNLILLHDSEEKMFTEPISFERKEQQP